MKELFFKNVFFSNVSDFINEIDIHLQNLDENLNEIIKAKIKEMDYKMLSFENLHD